MLLTGGLGIAVGVSRMEWLILLLTFSAVIVAEAINTAIERAVDLACLDTHPLARDAKDIAAGAVLIASLFALIIGAVIFLPYLG